MGGGQDQKKARGPTLAQSPSHLLHRAQQVAADEFASRLSKSGLTVRQYAVLTAVSNHPGLTQSSLVQITGVDRSTLADLIARMQERGLVARDRLEQDGRAKAVTLTEAGRAALTASEAKAQAADEAILAMLPKGKRQVFLTLLQRISGVTEADLQKGKGKGKKADTKANKTKKKADLKSKLAPSPAQPLKTEKSGQPLRAAKPAKEKAVKATQEKKPSKKKKAKRTAKPAEAGRKPTAKLRAT